MFNGIYTPIITPFTGEEKVDYTKMKHNRRNRTGRNSSARVQRRIRLPVGRREV